RRHRKKSLPPRSCGLVVAEGNSVIAGEEGFGFAIERVAAFLQIIRWLPRLIVTVRRMGDAFNALKSHFASSSVHIPSHSPRMIEPIIARLPGRFRGNRHEPRPGRSKDPALASPQGHPFLTQGLE